VKFISVESVTINKDQTKFVDDLKKILVENGINCPLHIYEPKTKKEDRIKFNLEAPMSQKALKINRNIMDKTFVPKLESQFLDFPNGKHDDIIDDISQ
jgi:phage terminase large subunit-like protein